MAALVILITPAIAFAHVVVTPSQVGVGQRSVFNISVPNERQSAVTAVKVAIPAGVSDVMPTAKEGWTITTAKSDGQDPETTWITWTGNLPEGQRQDFTFSAQAPNKATELNWKAYQTYADGTEVHWDQPPTDDHGDDDAATAGPFSVTKVVNDLNSSSSDTSDGSTRTTLALILSIAALALSVITLNSIRTSRRKK